MELGIYTFGDLVANPKSKTALSGQERMRQMIEMAKIAEDAGLDIVGVGEHHSLKFVNSATAVTIAAMAAVTKRIRFTSATTLLSTADPVRTFQEFATADLVSNGRVEIIFGRGAFTDNFPLFGFNINDYDALFIEKLGLFEELNANELVTWKGRFRPALSNAEIAPRPAQKKLPVWIGAGSAGSVARAASLGYPVAIPVLGGSLSAYAHTAAFYRQVWEQSGHAAKDIRLAFFSHLHVTGTFQQTCEDFYPNYSAYLEPLFKRPMPKEQYEQMLSEQGTLFGGSPQEVIDKILFLQEEMSASRYVGQIDIGGQAFSDVARGIELFGAKVVPVIRKQASSSKALL
jgi:alkanesulfonate monooxygenase SsuD/methylene tetrahydromethanopterin reductase-like flavin-dependent oxidoreductase (luciferase family)